MSRRGQVPEVRISQYVYFAIWSIHTPAAEITARLGIEPDEQTIRASKSAYPVRPVSHSWRVACRHPHLTVDEQINRIVDRLFPHAQRIGELASELERAEGASGGSRLQVVRVFEHPDGEQEDLTSPVDGLEKLAGQHQLLGWHLDARMLEFLMLTRADLDVDEYG